MTAPLDCRLIGRWRIVEADLWDRGYLDLVAAATMTIGADGHGEIAYGAMQASLELEYSHSMVFFTWAGFDEGDAITGSGSAELNDDGTIEIAFAYHLGDEGGPQSRTNGFFNSLLVDRLQRLMPASWRQR